MTILKSDLESTVTCADIHSGLAVLRFVADIIQIYENVSTFQDFSDIDLLISPYTNNMQFIVHHLFYIKICFTVALFRNLSVAEGILNFSTDLVYW